MLQTLNLSIGDISCAIEGHALHGSFDIPPSYQPFIGGGPPDLRLVLHDGPAEISCSEKIFDSPPIWSLFRSREQFAVKIFENLDGLQRTLVFPPDLASAMLYFNGAAGRFKDPFFGPTLELLMINHLARQQGVVLHSCGVAKDDNGTVFAGESGAGKSTMAGLWNRLDGMAVLSDDRTVVRKTGGEFRMYGTPWHGDAKFGLARDARLDRIFFIRHGDANRVREMSWAEAVQTLLTCAFPPYWDAAGMEFTLEFFSEMTAVVPCYELFFTPYQGVVDLISQV